MWYQLTLSTNEDRTLTDDVPIQTFEVSCEDAAVTAERAGFSNFAAALRDLGHASCPLSPTQSRIVSRLRKASRFQ